MSDFAGVIYDALNKARLESIDRQLHTRGAPELTDADYRLAVEYDLLGRPDPPDDERPWQFDGAADWWPPRVYPARWQQDRVEGYARPNAARWRTAAD